MHLDIPAGTPDRGPGLKALGIILIVLTTLMTLIRVISKVLTRQYWWWDDLFALLSWVGDLALPSSIVFTMAGPPANTDLLNQYSLQN